MKILLIEKDFIEIGTVMPRHSHSFWQLDYFDTKKGGVTVSVDGKKYPMSANEFILIKPYEEHKLIISKRSFAFTLKFELDDSFSEQLKTTVIPVKQNKDILQYFLADSTLSFKTGTKIMEHFLWIFLLRNFEDFFADSKEHFPAKNPVLIPVLEYLQRNITENLSLSEIASMASLSVSHFIKIFRDETGVPPLAYINSLRMERARKLLKYSDMNISMIADSLKYPDIHSFSRAFKKACGCSPSQYRNDFRDTITF